MNPSIGLSKFSALPHPVNKTKTTSKNTVIKKVSLPKLREVGKNFLNENAIISDADKNGMYLTSFKSIIQTKYSYTKDNKKYWYEG